MTALRNVLITQSQHKSIVLNSSQENTRCERLELVKVSDFLKMEQIWQEAEDEV